MKVYLNGKFIDKEKAVVSVFDPGFLYGQGLFETMRAYGNKVFRIDSHIKRLFDSLPLIKMELSLKQQELKSAVKDCLSENNLKCAYVRITAWQAEDRTNCMLFSKKQDFMKKEDYERGFKSILSTHRQNEYSILSRIKSSNYLHLLLSYRQAKARNADEALLLNTKGFLSEASRANIFLVKDNCLITPSVESGCLRGITREVVFEIALKEKIKVYEKEISIEDLERSDEAFLTNSLIEIMPMVSFQGKPIKKGLPGKITQVILKKYRDLVLKG